MEQQTASYPTMTALEFGMPNIHEDSHSRGALTDSPNTENGSQTASHTNLAEMHLGHMMQPAMHFPESHGSDGSNGPLHPCEPILFFHPDDSMAQTQPAGKQGEKQLARMRNSARIQKRSALEKKCKCCGTMNTPVWRWGGDAKDTLLCNACSLRIRRSNARPQRTKSPTERPQRKQQSNSTQSNSDSGGGVRQLTPEEIDALRQRLAGFMIQEKERLLGGEALDDYMWDRGSGEMEGKFKQQPYIMAPPSIYPSEVQVSPYGFSREAPWNENGFVPRNPRDPYLDQLHDQELAYIPF